MSVASSCASGSVEVSLLDETIGDNLEDVTWKIRKVEMRAAAGPGITPG